MFWNCSNLVALLVTLKCRPADCEKERRPILASRNKSPTSKSGWLTHTHTHTVFPSFSLSNLSQRLISSAFSSFSHRVVLAFMNLSSIDPVLQLLCFFSPQRRLADETGHVSARLCRLLLSHLSRITELWNAIRAMCLQDGFLCTVSISVYLLSMWVIELMTQLVHFLFSLLSYFWLQSKGISHCGDITQVTAMLSLQSISVWKRTMAIKTASKQLSLAFKRKLHT